MAADLKRLHGALPGEVAIADRALDDRHWVVAANAAETPDDLPPLPSRSW